MEKKMKVERISFKALKAILNGEIREEATCIIKFYSNECKYCHALRGYYEELASSYDDVYFFAFNTGDTTALERYIQVEGVPSIVLVQNTERHKPVVHLIDEPTNPNDHTWYRVSDIRRFIERHK
jgi:thiol-disulfide isomerase/thioredoxin